MIIFRVLWYASNSAIFEITEINNSSKCLREGGCDDLKALTLRGGYLEKVQLRTRGEGGARIDEIQRVDFLNGPYRGKGDIDRWGVGEKYGLIRAGL